MHERVTATVPVAKESHELAQAIVDVVKNVVLANKDGFQPGTDIPAVLLGSINSLATGLEGANKIAGEYKHDPGCFARAWALAGADIIDLLIPHED